MKEKEVLLVLTDEWADWEASHAIVGVNDSLAYVVKTIAIDKNPKTSIGGLRTEIDYEFENYHHFDNLAMVILTGSFSWNEKKHDVVADFIKKVVDANIPIAAICGGTRFLAKHGFLNNVKHTGNSLKYFKEILKDEQKYTGQDFFVATQIMSDGGIITAVDTASVEFAYEIFKTLAVDEREDIDEWYNKFKMI